MIFDYIETFYGEALAAFGVAGSDRVCSCAITGGESGSANRALGCDFFKGLAMKRGESSYPQRLRSATEELRGWVKHRFLL